MNRILLFGIASVIIISCSSTKKEVTISPYSTASLPVGQSALVYALPQTRLFFDVEISKMIIRKGPYSEYANRMLGLQNVPTKDSESWHLKSIRISDRQEVDGKHLYSLSFTDYPQNMDKLLRFTKNGLILDLTVGNILFNNQNQGNTDDSQLFNTIVRNTSIEKVDTLYQPYNVDTAFVYIPILQRRVLSKTTEELAREAAEQIFDIRKWRIDILRGDSDNPPADGEAFKLVLQTLDRQEEQLLSLFTGAKVEKSQTVTYSALPEKPASSIELFYFSERAGIVGKNAAGAKAVWCEFGKVTVPISLSPGLQAKNLIYYRIPPVVEVSAGIDRTILVSEQVTVCQFGSIVSFPLAAPKK